MNSRNILGYVSAAALATGAAVIGQNQPAYQPAKPSASQPTTAQPGSAQPGMNNANKGDDQARWRDMADKVQQMNQRMDDRNQKLAQQLAQAQTQTGEARVNAIAEVLTGVLQEQARTNREIVHLQRMAFHSHFESANMNQEWDSWKQQYPFLDESKDQGQDNTPSDTSRPGTGRDRDNNTSNPGTTTPRNPR